MQRPNYNNWIGAINRSCVKQLRLSQSQNKVQQSQGILFYPFVSGLYTDREGSILNAANFVKAVRPQKVFLEMCPSTFSKITHHVSDFPASPYRIQTLGKTCGTIQGLSSHSLYPVIEAAREVNAIVHPIDVHETLLNKEAHITLINDPISIRGFLLYSVYSLALTRNYASLQNLKILRRQFQLLCPKAYRIFIEDRIYAIAKTILNLDASSCEKTTTTESTNFSTQKLCHNVLTVVVCHGFRVDGLCDAVIHLSSKVEPSVETPYWTRQCPPELYPSIYFMLFMQYAAIPSFLSVVLLITLSGLFNWGRTTWSRGDIPAAKQEVCLK